MIKINGKEVNTKSFEWEDLYKWDYPDFSDAFVSYAEFTDGTELTDDDYEVLHNDYGCELDMYLREYLN